MVKKKTNLDDLLKEIKDNSFNFKVEEIESSDILSEENIQLEKIKGEIRKLEKRGQFAEIIKNKIKKNINSIFGGFIGIFSTTIFTLIVVMSFSMEEEIWEEIMIIFYIIWISIAILLFTVVIYLRYFYTKRLQNSLNNLIEEKRKLELPLTKIEKMLEKERLLGIINEGGMMLNERDFSNALKVFERAQKILRTSPSLQNYKEIQNILESKIKLVQEKLNELKIGEINPIIEQGNLLKNQNLNDKAIEVFKKALEITNNLFKSPERDQKLKEIKSLIDINYLNKIKEINAKGNQLRNQNKFDRAIQTFRNALPITEYIYSSSKRKKEIQNIENLIDHVCSDMISEKMKTGNELRKQMKFDDSIKDFNKGLNLAKKIYNSSKKNNEISKLKSLVNQSKIAKIKNTILNLGTKFGRLHIMEISEECGEDESLIISIVREMIESSEIYAKYFESTKSVAFDQQANIEEIDKLMEQYKQWEKEGISKK